MNDAATATDVSTTCPQAVRRRPDPADSVVVTSGLTKRYEDKTAVNGLGFAVPRGTVCGFIGPNGAGKTTTIRMLLGLITPTSGGATVLGHPIASPTRFMHRVGAMIEGPAFYPTLSGRRNLEVLARLARVRRQRVDEVLDIVSMTAAADRPFKSYSLGMKQRIGLAAALLDDPELLILDEPTNGLDPPGIREVRDLLRGLADSGKTVLVSSHLLDELQHIIDHVVVIVDGAGVFDGTLAELMANQQPELIARTERVEDLSVLVELCRETGLSATAVDGQLHLEASQDRAAWLNRAAMDRGIVLTGLMAVQPRLEDVFFDLTEERAR